MEKKIDPEKVNFSVDDGIIAGVPIQSHDLWIPQNMYTNEGAMGTLYIAEHPSIPYEKVMIKFLGNDKLSSEISKYDPTMAMAEKKEMYMKRFLREIETMLKANEPYCKNIAEVYDWGMTENNNLYLVMEYVDGFTLRNVLSVRSGKLSVEEICVLEMQMLNAMGNAHRQHIVHRDLKPDNVMIDHKYLVKILDFGVSYIQRKRMDHSDMLLTKAHQGVGTSPYMSRFQIDPPRIDISESSITKDEEDGKEYCQIKGNRYLVSRDDKGAHVRIVPRHADLATLCGTMLFEMIMGYNHFTRGIPDVERVPVDALIQNKILNTKAKHMHVDDAKSIPKAARKGFNSIIDEVMPVNIEDVCGSAYDLQGRFYDMFRKHKGELWKKFGRLPAEREVLKYCMDQTDAEYKERAYDIAEVIRVGSISRFNEAEVENFIKDISVLYKTRGDKGGPVGRLIDIFNNSSSMLGKLQFSKGTDPKEIKTHIRNLEFHQRVADELQKYNPGFRKMSTTIAGKLTRLKKMIR